MTIATTAKRGLDTRVIETWEDLLGLREPWRELLDRCPAASIFDTWEWNANTWQYFPDGRIFVVTAEYGGDLVGVAPLVQRGRRPWRTLGFMGAAYPDYGIADYGDILLAAGLEDAALEAIVQELAANAGRWDILDLQEVPASSRLMAEGPRLARSHSLAAYQATQQSECYRICLPNSWESYTRGLSANTKANLLRKTRKLEREHRVEIERVEQRAQLERAMETLFALHTERWENEGQRGIFGEEQRRRRDLALAALLLDRGWLSLSTMRVDGSPVAAIYNFDLRERTYYYASGFSVEADWSPYSLGSVLLGYAIKTAIGEEKRSFDLLRGDREYKLRYAPETAVNYRVRMCRSREQLAAYLKLRKLRRGMQALRRRFA